MCRFLSCSRLFLLPIGKYFKLKLAEEKGEAGRKYGEVIHKGVPAIQPQKEICL